MVDVSKIDVQVVSATLTTFSIMDLKQSKWYEWMKGMFKSVTISNGFDLMSFYFGKRWNAILRGNDMQLISLEMDWVRCLLYFSNLSSTKRKIYAT